MIPVRFICLYIIGSLLLAGMSHAGPAVPDAEKFLQKRVDAVRRAGAEDIARIRAENAALSEEIRVLEKEVQAVEAARNAETRRFETLKAEEDRLRAAIREEVEMVKQLDETGRAAARKLLRQVADAPPVPGLQEASDQVSLWLASDHFPGESAVSALCDLMIGLIRAAGEVAVYDGSWTGADGRKVSGRIVRMGLLSAAGVSDTGEAVFLSPRSDGAGLKSALRDMPSGYARSIGAYVRFEDSRLPVDLSHGAVFPLMAETGGLSSWIEKGGAMVWPLFLIAAAGVILFVVQAVFLVFQRKAPADLLSLLQDSSLHPAVGAERMASLPARSPACRAISLLLAESSGKAVTAESLELAMTAQLPKLERFLSSLQVMAAVAPMIGLLGTVTGMIHAFRVLSLYGSVDPQLMSGGISEALITTQLGLGIAIPIMAFHHLLDWRVNRLTDDMTAVLGAFRMAWNGEKDDC